MEQEYKFSSPLSPPRCEGCGAEIISSAPVQDDTYTMGGLVPYKNPSALTSYYLGVFSLLPCFGVFLAPAAIVLGVKGLKFAKTHPSAKGEVHSWLGIVLGSIFLLLNILALLLVVLASAKK